MRKILFSFYLITLFLNLQASDVKQDPKSGLVGNTTVQTFTGTINGKLNVVFQLSTVKGNVNGFYMYDKIGVEIILSGTITNNEILLYELDYLENRTAKITGMITKDGFTGKWESLIKKRTFPIILAKTNKKIIPLPINLTGRYEFSSDNGCDLELFVYRLKGDYLYQLTAGKRILRGDVIFSRSLDEGQNYIKLQGISYSAYYGNVSKTRPDDSPVKKTASPGYIEGYIDENTITIQNLGNAMNQYIILAECKDVKYIILKKDE